MIKGLIQKLLPKDKPKIFNDPFLEKEFDKLQKKRDFTQNPVEKIFTNPSYNDFYMSPRL